MGVSPPFGKTVLEPAPRVSTACMNKDRGKPYSLHLFSIWLRNLLFLHIFLVSNQVCIQVTCLHWLPSMDCYKPRGEISGTHESWMQSKSRYSVENLIFERERGNHCNIFLKGHLFTAAKFEI